MSVVLKIAGQSAYFLVGNVFTLVVGLLFQIYLARHLHADGIGLFGLLEGGVGLFTALLGLGVAQVAVRYVPEHLKKKQYAELHVLVKGSFAVITIAGLIGLTLVYLGAPILERHWPELASHRTELLIAAWMIPIGMLLFLSVQILRGFYDIRYVVMGSSFLQLIVKVAISVTLFALGMMVVGYLWAVVLSMATALGWMLLGIRKHLSRYPVEERLAYRLMPEWKSYAKTMYGNNMINFWMRPLDRFLLGYFAGAGAVGVLMIVRTLFGLPSIILQMFLSIAAPMLAGAHAEENKNEIVHIYHLTTDWLVRLTFPLVLFLAVFANDLLILFGPTFAKEGTLLLQLLLLAQLINLGCGPLGNVLNMCGLEREKFVATIIASIVGAVIMAWGAYSMGILGVGIGIASVILLGNTFSILIAKWKMQLSWWDKRYKKWWIPMLANSSIVMMFGLFGSDMGIPGLVAMLVISYISFHGIYFIFGKNEDDVIILDAVKRRMNYGNR